MRSDSEQTATTSSTPNGTGARTELRFWWLLLVPISIFILLLVTPQSFIGDYKWVELVINRVYEMVPLRRPLPESPLPLLVQLAAALSIVLIWVQAFIVAAVVIPNRLMMTARIESRKKASWRQVFLAAAVMTYVCIVYLIPLFPSSGANATVSSIESSRLLIAFVYSAIVAILPISTAMLILAASRATELKSKGD